MLATYFTLAFRYIVSFSIDLFFGLLVIWVDFKAPLFNALDFKEQLTIQERATIMVAIVSTCVILFRLLGSIEDYTKKRIERKKAQYDFDKQKEIDLINLNKENEQRESNTN